MTAPGFAFVDAPLDRADHLRGDAARLDALRAGAKCIVLDAQGRALCDAAGVLSPQATTGDAVFLGLEGDVAWFARSDDGAFAADAPRLDVRSAATQWPAVRATLFAQARAVLHWRATHRHCASCGATLAFSRGGWQGDCASCGATHYPRTDPAVIVAVSDGERILLGRQAGWPPRRHSTLAGFVEPGEALEHAIVREVWEESRVRVLRSRYLASQPWPFPGSLMLGFVAHALPDVPQTAQDELQDARWFTRDEVQAALDADREDAPLRLSPPLSISRWLIERWLDGERA